MSFSEDEKYCSAKDEKGLPKTFSDWLSNHNKYEAWSTHYDGYGNRSYVPNARYIESVRELCREGMTRVIEIADTIPNPVIENMDFLFPHLGQLKHYIKYCGGLEKARTLDELSFSYAHGDCTSEVWIIFIYDIQKQFGKLSGWRSIEVPSTWLTADYEKCRELMLSEAERGLNLQVKDCRRILEQEETRLEPLRKNVADAEAALRTLEEMSAKK